MFFTLSFWVTFFTILASLFVALLAFFNWRYQYWQRRNLYFLPPRIPYGNSANPFRRRENVGFRMKHHYDKMKAKKWKHGGIYLFTNPTYFLIDLDYVKNIMTKDFQYFTDRGTFYNEKDDPLSAHLFAIGGQKWRNLRMKLTPTFTSGKMKMMFQMLLDCVPNLAGKIQVDMDKKTAIDIKEVLGCFTTDIIGSCAFGLDCNTFQEDNSPFREYGRKVFAMSPFQLFKLLFSTVFPNVARAFSVTITPKDVTDFFMKVVKDTIEYREKNHITRNDFMQLLIELKNAPDEPLTFQEVAAQSFVFFIAGFETSSTTMTFALYELARNQEIQDRVRAEIYEVLEKHNGEITYEAMHEMKYLDQVVSETLRIYPPVPFLTRKCIKDYKVPDEDVVIEKGVSVVIPVLAIHYDEDNYPDPLKFDPERFNEENKNKRHNYAFLPFGEGPRVCIGMRFGLMQSKVGLVSLLRSYRFRVNEKTQEPLKMKINSFVLAAEGEIWLDAEKL